MSQREYFSKWYYVAVREALAIHPVRNDPGELSDLLLPAITPSQARAAVKSLEALQMIFRDGEGRWRATQTSLLSQQDESTALLVRGFQGEMMDLAKRALTEMPKGERDISCVTMSVSSQGLERIKSMIKECRQRILEIVQSDRDEDSVIQIRIQVFPITTPKANHASVFEIPKRGPSDLVPPGRTPIFTVHRHLHFRRELRRQHHGLARRYGASRRGACLRPERPFPPALRKSIFLPTWSRNPNSSGMR